MLREFIISLAIFSIFIALFYFKSASMRWDEKWISTAAVRNIYRDITINPAIEYGGRKKPKYKNIDARSVKISPNRTSADITFLYTDQNDRSHTEQHIFSIRSVDVEDSCNPTDTYCINI